MCACRIDFHPHDVTGGQRRQRASDVTGTVPSPRAQPPQPSAGRKKEQTHQAYCAAHDDNVVVGGSTRLHFSLSLSLRRRVMPHAGNGTRAAQTQMRWIEKFDMCCCTFLSSASHLCNASRSVGPPADCLRQILICNFAKRSLCHNAQAGKCSALAKTYINLCVTLVLN